jgi:SAM-dependent methyltransferase
MPLDTAQYWEQRLTADYSLNAVGWVGLGHAFNGWMYAVRRRVFRRLVRSHLPLSGDPRVLDVGSGTGFYLERWRELGVRRVEGSDLTQVATRNLTAAHPDLAIHRFDIGGDPELLPTGSYDAVSAMDMLYHIVEPAAYVRAIANLASLLAPGGHLVMTENLVRGDAVAGPHQVSRTESEVLGLLGEHGLEPVATAPVFVVLNTPVDSDSRLLHHWWSLLARVAGRNEALGWLAGALLMPVELLATRLVRRGPSTKMLVCRRRAITEPPDTPRSRSHSTNGS